TGTPQQGQTLTEHNGRWANEPTSFAYQWLQCNTEGNSCTAISGATKQTYEVAAGDVGHTIRVQETASNVFGSGNPVTSEATAVVTPAAPTNISAPTITGTARQGQTLTEHNGEWTNSPTSFTYQSQQCNTQGNSCTAISGATKQTYEVAAGDVGHTIRAQETAPTPCASLSPSSSAATAVVTTPAPANISPPTITGTAQQGQTLTEHNGAWTNSPT